jgi:hypothetical protein
VRICAKRFAQGLNKLRKKAFIRANGAKDKPQGLKPALIMRHFRHD